MATWAGSVRGVGWSPLRGCLGVALGGGGAGSRPGVTFGLGASSPCVS